MSESEREREGGGGKECDIMIGCLLWSSCVAVGCLADLSTSVGMNI